MKKIENKKNIIQIKQFQGYPDMLQNMKNKIKPSVIQDFDQQQVLLNFLSQYFYTFLLKIKSLFLQLRSMIDLNQLEPDLQFAFRHGKATLPGNIDLTGSNSMSTAICPCCFQFIYKDPMPLCVNSKQLQSLGFGFPLFYTFLKNCVMFLIVSICSYNALSLKKAFDYTYTHCHEAHRRLLGTGTGVSCTTFMIQMSRIQPLVTSQQQILRITSFIMQMLFLIYMRDHITKLEQYYDERNTSFSDFSIMLKNIPKQVGIQKTLKQFFAKAFPQEHQIKQITLLPQYPEIDHLLADRHKIIQRLRKCYKKDEFSEEDEKDKGNLRKIDQAIEQQVHISNQFAKKDQLQCQKVVLVFNTDQEKSQVIKQFKKMDYSSKGPYFGRGSEKITIKQAPQPKQIIWTNVNVSTQKKIFLYILSWGLSILLLAIATIVFYFIMEQKALNLLHAIQQLAENPNEEKYQTKYKGAVALTYIMLFFIVLFNKLVMSTLFHKFTDMQRPQTRSKFQFSFSLKYCLGLFFTTALMTLSVQAIRFDNYYSHAYGVIQQETIMFILNAVFVPIYWLINPFFLVRKIKRYFSYGKKYFTQKQANLLMEESHYEMGKRYAQIIQTMWFTFLYATLVPIGAFISLIGIILYYWVDKYTLLRKSSLGGEVSGKLVLASMKMLDFTLILKPAGELLFDIQMRSSSGLISSSVMIAIAILYFILPLDKIIQIINPEKFKPEQKTYEEIKNNFKDTYHTEHPIYRLIHAEKFRKKFSKKGLSFDYNGINNTQFLVQLTGHSQEVQQNLKRKQNNLY